MYTSDILSVKTISKWNNVKTDKCKWEKDICLQRKVSCLCPLANPIGK